MTEAARAGRWGDLAVRVASAAVLAPLGLAAIWQGGTLWEALMLLIAVGLGVEWAMLCGFGASAGRAGVVPMVMLLAVAGMVYIGVGAISLLHLRHEASGLADVLLVVLVVWGCDIGAYLVGRLVGGPRLAPLVSPGKTWSGAIGGLACGTAAGTALAGGFGAGAHGMLTAAGLSAVLSILAQAGDLLESALKRHFNKKDSGWLIPGHGGLLDRLDGLIAAAPAAWLLSLGAVPGKPLWDWGA